MYTGSIRTGLKANKRGTTRGGGQGEMPEGAIGNMAYLIQSDIDCALICKFGLAGSRFAAALQKKCCIRWIFPPGRIRKFFKHKFGGLQLRITNAVPSTPLRFAQDDTFECERKESKLRSFGGQLGRNPVLGHPRVAGTEAGRFDGRQSLFPGSQKRDPGHPGPDRTGASMRLTSMCKRGVSFRIYFHRPARPL